MAIVTFRNYARGQSRTCMAAVMKYAQREDKVKFGDQRLVTGINCRPDTVYDDFMRTKLLYHKDDGVLFYHMVQSFPKGADIEPKVAHAAAIELAGYFKDCEVLVCTHTDRDHIHSHCIINSVNFETGKKLHMADKQIQELRERNDMVCAKFGLPVFEQTTRQKTKPMTIGEYHVAAKGQSWKFRLMGAIDECMKYARTREEFIALMESEGYGVRWTDTRKYITYTTPDGDRCRDNKLHDKKYLKEYMEHEFNIRQALLDGRTEGAQRQRPVDGERGREAHHADGQKLDGGAEPALAVEYAAARPRGSTRSASDESGRRGAAEQDRREHSDAAPQAELGGRVVLSTGWEDEREIFLRRRQAGYEYGEGAVFADELDAGQPRRAAAQDRFADGQAVQRDNTLDQGDGHRVYRGGSVADDPLHRDHAAAAGIGAALGVAAAFDDDDREDADERRRRIEAREAVQNLGTAIGLAAGLALGISEKHRQQQEGQQDQQQQNTMTQSM